MKRVWHLSIAASLIGLLSFVNPAPLSAADDTKETDRVRNAGKVAKEIMDIPDDIPQDLIDKADCVIVLPSVLKAAFIVGASYGRGVMSCRGGDGFRGPWSAPSMMALEGGSFGFQIGGQETDVVMLFMTPDSLKHLLKDKVTLGVDASAAGGDLALLHASDPGKSRPRAPARTRRIMAALCRLIMRAGDPAGGRSSRSIISRDWFAAYLVA